MSEKTAFAVRCERHPGVFSSESAVKLKSTAGETVSLFVDNRLVQDKGNESYVKVSLVQKGRDVATVLLPSETFELGSRWVDVPTASLTEYDSK